MSDFEADVLKTVQLSVQDSIKTVLTGYNSPLVKLVSQVVDSHSKELLTLIDGAFSSVIKTEEFKESVVAAFSHKISRSLISSTDGLFEKVSNTLKQDPVFRSKLTIAVANVVEECMKKDKK